MVAALESMGGRYTCTHPSAQFTLFERGRPIEPLRVRSLTSDGDARGWYLSHPDTPEILEFFTQGLAREDAWGRPTNVHGSTITKVSRIVYDRFGKKCPATTAPIPTDYFHQASGPAVLIAGEAHLIDALWDAAWGPGHEAQRGYSDQADDDDGDFKPARRPASDRPRRRPRLRPAAPADPGRGPAEPSSKGRMGSKAPGSRGHMGYSGGPRGHMGSSGNGPRGRKGRS